MPAAAQHADIATPECAADWERALLDHQLAELGRLAQMGMAIAGAIERLATTPASQPDGDAAGVLHHAAMDFARVSRAVRMSFALQSRLIADFKAPPAGRNATAAFASEEDIDWPGGDDLFFTTPAPPSAALRDTKLGKVIRHIADCVEPDAERLERVLAEAAERLERDDIHRELARRPFGEVIALICRDLGLEPDWNGVPHKTSRLGWASYDDIRQARDFALSLSGRRAPPPSPEDRAPGGAADTS